MAGDGTLDREGQRPAVAPSFLSLRLAGACSRALGVNGLPSVGSGRHFPPGEIGTLVEGGGPLGLQRGVWVTCQDCLSASLSLNSFPAPAGAPGLGGRESSRLPRAVALGSNFWLLGLMCGCWAVLVVWPRLIDGNNELAFQTAVICDKDLASPLGQGENHCCAYR